MLVDPSDFFIQDIASVSSFFSRYLKEGSYSFDNDNSYFGALKNFPRNTEIDVVLHFTIQLAQNGHSHPSGYAQFPAHLSLQLVQSARVGFPPALGRRPSGAFHHACTKTTHQCSRTTRTCAMSNRWHLEKAEPKFDQSPPKKPIVFWLENTIPPEYRDAVREGILVWNKGIRATRL